MNSEEMEEHRRKFHEWLCSCQLFNCYVVSLKSPLIMFVCI